MPIQRTLNKRFFKIRSPEMAYVLGYIAADGAIWIGKRNNCYMEVQSIDYELPLMVRRALSSNHKISSYKPKTGKCTRYRLQIGSKQIINDLNKLGIVPQKSRRLLLPDIPDSIFRDFVRGYFDGDGNIYHAVFARKDRPGNKMAQWIRILFTSCSLQILKDIDKKLSLHLKIRPGKIKKINTYYILYYYPKNDVQMIFNFLYGHKPKYYLKRKFQYFKTALKKVNGPVV